MEEKFKSGFVSILGRTNVGKSSIINNLVGEKVAAIANKPQTTRTVIRAIVNRPNFQIIFIDTPGIHKPKSKLGNVMVENAFEVSKDVDVVVFVVEATSEDIGKGDRMILDKIKEAKANTILVINKIDLVTKEQIFKLIEAFKDEYHFKAIIPISALKEDNLKTLLKVMKSYLKEGACYYEEGDITNQSTRFLLSELIREKVFRLTEEEIPHSVACTIESIETKKNSVTIYADIITDRESIKKIIVGANGQMIKKIGTYAREDMEEMLGKKVYLNLLVKVVKNWRDKDKYLKEFGYQDL